MQSKTLTITIERPANEVYEFIRNLANLPKWANTFCQAIQPYNDDFWLAVTPIGPVKIKMAPRNDYGICDHLVIPDPLVEIMVPMRVICNEEFSSDVIFTLFRQPGMPTAKYEEDSQMVMQDLRTLKSVLESQK